MTPEYINMVTDQTFIRYTGQLFEWAQESATRLRELPEQSRWRIKKAHAGLEYLDQAVELVNQEYRDELCDHDLPAIRTIDLARSYHLTHSRVPDDLVGIVYFWFSNHAPLYLQTRDGDSYYQLESTNRGGAKQELFREFVEWVDRNNRLNNLKNATSGDLYMDEVQGQFNRIIDAVTSRNSYLDQLFQQRELAVQDPSSDALNLSGRSLNAEGKG